MTTRGSTLLVLTLFLLLIPSRGLQAEAPPIDAYLDIDTRPVILSSATRSFWISYGFGTPLTQEEFRARFPESFDGGYQDNCGIRTLEGVQVTLDAVMSWDFATVWRGDPTHPAPEGSVTLTPEALHLLVYDDTPADLNEMVLFDPAMQTVYEGESVRSAALEIEATQFYGDPVAWTATITFEAWCRYLDSQTGNVVAILTTSDLGGEPLTLTESDEDIPRYGIPVAGESWSAVKSLYRR